MSPEGDIPAPDLNTTPQIMAWIMDTYSMHRGYPVPAVVTGKPVPVGGALRVPRGGEPIPNEGPLVSDCDVLIPAALEQQITAATAERVRARLVVEGANGPTTPEADAILAARGGLVVPDILAHAGGGVVAYFGWVRGLPGC